MAVLPKRGILYCDYYGYDIEATGTRPRLSLKDTSLLIIITEEFIRATKNDVHS